MKKKLAKIFGLILTGAMAFSVVGCGDSSTSGSESSSASEGGETTSAKTVTAQEFKAGIENLMSAEDYTGTILGEMRGDQIVTIIKDDNITYVSPVYIDPVKGALTAYIQYDDENLSAVMYSSYATAPDVWEKDTGTSSTAESFASQKESMGLASNVGLTYLYSTTDGGETAELGDLYSSFTFNETTEKYEGSVFMFDTSYDPETQEDVEEYTAVTLSFDFTDGALVGFVLTMGELTLEAAISYEATTVTIPEAALNAQEK